MSPSAQLVKKLEIEYLRILSGLLKKNEIQTSEAKKSAQEFLKLLPFSSVDDLELKIKKFIQSFPLLLPLHITVLKYKEEYRTQTVLERMRVLMKSNRIDEAITLAKQ